jgi:hypothetical protein
MWRGRTWLALAAIDPRHHLLRDLLIPILVRRDARERELRT